MFMVGNLNQFDQNTI